MTEQEKVRALKECCEAWEKGCRQWQYFDYEVDKWRDSEAETLSYFATGGTYRPRPGWDRKPEMVPLDRRDVMKVGRVFRWNYGGGTCYVPMAANEQGVWLLSVSTKMVDQVLYDYLRDNAEYSDDLGETWHKCEKEAK